MWQNPQETADLARFTEETLNGKLHYLCSDYNWKERSRHHSNISWRNSVLKGYIAEGHLEPCQMWVMAQNFDNASSVDEETPAV